ncbi:MAG: hypothetical protein ACI9DC_002062 [Gammaproteobacteria bacterium]|jgi:hypothetical protein
MGVLDELKQEAVSIEAKKAREKTSRAAAHSRARERVVPCMRTAYTYFSELKQHLQVVKRQVEASYDIRDVGRVDGLQQGQYGVSTENPEQLDKFSFRCVCAKSGILQVNHSDVASVASYRDYLRSNGLQAKVRDASKGGKGGAIFMVQPAVPVVVELSADYERAVVVLRVRNLSNIGVGRHTLTPEQVDEKFLDEIAKAILRQPNQFDIITGEAISDTTKHRLKERIRAAVRQNELADEMAQREADKERTITKRLSRTFLGRDK